MKRPILSLVFLLTSLMGYAQKSSAIFTTDIDNFWIAYDSVQTTGDTTRQLGFIQTIYLDQATDGLKDFIKLREHSAKRHLNNILKAPKFWPSVRPKTLAIKDHAEEIETIIQNFKNSYEDFREPSIYFTIGVLNSGGTTNPDKVLIGAEIACADKTVDAIELNKWLQDVFKSNSDIVSLVAHELGHTQQKDGDVATTLLAYCIREGACDLIAELIHKPVTSPYMTYGNLHEDELWNDFKKEMAGTEIKNWLYNGDNAPNGVADLGYFMGYTICKSYYDNSKNKRRAIKEIVELQYDEKTVNAFLKKSKYNGLKKHVQN